MAQVRLEAVRKVYNDTGAEGTVAVHGIDLDVRNGEFVVLVGPSGCGKTTVLRMIAGLETATSGRIMINGRVVNDLPPKARDIAMVFQNYALYPHLTVFENMAFALRLRKQSHEEIERQVRAAATTLGLERALSRKPAQLSGGERQRVAIGRAIVRNPRVFLFDEPLSNLDAALRAQMRREIAALHRTLRATMIYVTHDQIEAMTLGDRIVVMAGGRVQQIDSPVHLYDYPQNQFVATFIGSPAMRLIAGTVSNGASLVFRSTPSGAIEILLSGPLAERLRPFVGRPVQLGVRAEAVELGVLRQDEGPAARFRAEIDAVEPMGSDALLYARTADAELTARIPSHHLPLVGAAVDLAVGLDRLYPFDGQTGAAILPSPA